MLTAHFAAVRATDVNLALVDRAIRHERIVYSVEAAEKAAIRNRSIDLVVVAQALHWLELDPFYAEVQRVLSTGGVFASWCYGRCRVAPEVDRWVKRLSQAVEPHWPKAFKFVAGRFRGLPFPFAEIPTPQFWISAWWSCQDFLDHLRSWTATRRLMALDHQVPVRLLKRVAAAWGQSDRKRLIRWPINLRVGRCRT